MKISVLGTGMVGQEIASQLANKGYEVMMGSRTAKNEKASSWVGDASNRHHGTFETAAKFSDQIVFNCTNGAHTLAVLQQAGATNLAGKILIDISNPLDFSNGMPPSLSIVNTDSQGEMIQREFPDTQVVKTLNTLNNQIMLNPNLLNGKHTIFLAGNEENAKTEVKQLLQKFDWPAAAIIDLGDITGARATEMLLPIWLRLYSTFGHANFNFYIEQNH